MEVPAALAAPQLPARLSDLLPTDADGAPTRPRLGRHHRSSRERPAVGASARAAIAGDVEAILTLNVATFAALNLLLSDAAAMDHFACGPGNAAARPWTLLTSLFSHVSVRHLLQNMQTLVSVAPLVQSALGRRRFLALYLGGGLAANAAGLLYAAATRQRGRRSMGASGAIFALLAANAAMFPDVVYVWYGGLELTALQLLGANVALDALGGAMARDGVDVVAHAGGAAFGAAFWQLVVQRGRLSDLWRAPRGGRLPYAPSKVGYY